SFAASTTDSTATLFSGEKCVTLLKKRNEQRLTERGEATMTRPLDNTALLAYFRRLKLSKEAQELLTHIRTSPPSRTPGARRGNMPIWYPSKKMHCIIKAESHKVEFAFLLQVEHD